MGNSKNKARHNNYHRRVFSKRKPPRQYKKATGKCTIQGSRIINIDKLGEYVSSITQHSATCGGSVILSGEKRAGLASILSSKCTKCNHTISFATSKKVKGPRRQKRWECNLAAVWGQMATGGGHASLTNSMSVLGVPVMSKGSFTPTEADIGEWWSKKLKESMIEAGKQEKILAEENGDYHQGVPSITVIVDGGVEQKIPQAFI